MENTHYITGENKRHLILPHFRYFADYINVWAYDGQTWVGVYGNCRYGVWNDITSVSNSQEALRTVHTSLTEVNPLPTSDYQHLP